MSQLSNALGRDNPDAWSQLRDLERRDADVRTLDEWAAIDEERYWQCGYECVLWDSSESPGRHFDGVSFSDSRAKAAAWVREQGIESGKGGDDV